MDGAAVAASLGVLLQIVFLDLLLGGDNALVIALACRRLPAGQALRAAWLGAAGAIVFRLILTSMTAWLMKLPFLQLLSALPLLIIAMNLMKDEPHETPHISTEAAKGGMLAAASIIIVSDAAMSIDNVVALAAVSGGNFWLLAFGLGLSIPIIVFGSFGFSRLMRIFPLLVDIGSAMLGWVAGGMIVADPLFGAWLRIQAPALDLAVPLACAVFVLAQGHFARDRDRAARKAPAAPFASPLAEKIVAAPAQAAKIAMPETLPVAVDVPRAPPAEPDAAAQEGGDRWMVLGLLALFVVFGLFLTAVVMISD